MIKYVRRKYTWDEIKKKLDDDVASWFSKFKSLTPPQEYGIIPISENKNTLICAPTGSGKTLTAFLYILSELFSLAKKGKLEDRVYCVYVSPLRALNNDIYKNLLKPIKEIGEICKDKTSKHVEIRVDVRTGDAPQSKRSQMLKKPPHILITTPETFGIVIATPKFKEHLRKVKWVIIDEIHSICENKRGVHLAISLERLQEICETEFVRIGLSATINPLEEVAKFLVGFKDSGEPRACYIVDARFEKKMDLKLISPLPDLLESTAEKTSNEMYGILSKIITTHRTTLIFTNTRSGTERVVYHLRKLGVFDADELGAHHSSLSRVERLEVENKLRNGEMKGVVTSTSLELGIDIGYIDVVVQIGSPKGVNRGLQRIGRSGHSIERTSKGIFLAMDLDDLIEDAVLIKEALSGHLDKIHIPRNCLDVLAQHIVGMVLLKKWSVEEAYKLVKRSYPYKDLSKEDFINVLRYLSGGSPNLEKYRVYGKIWFREEEGVFGRRGKLLRPIYFENIGTIPEYVSVRVYCGSRYVGRLEEEFVEQLFPGDLFILGGKVYRFKKAKGMKAYVEPAEGEKPTVPSWFSELLPLSFELGEAVSKFRFEVWKLLENGQVEEAIKFVRDRCKANKWAAESIVKYIDIQRKFLKHLKIDKFHSPENLLIEHHIEANKVNYIFHTVFGRRVNNVLSRALANLLRKKIKVSVKLMVDDNGFVITLPRYVKVDIKEALNRLSSENVREEIEEAVINSQFVWRSFRHCATRGLMILRRYLGHEVRVTRQQTNAESLFKICSQIPDFPLVKEAVREIVEDKMDVNNAVRVLKDIHEGKRRWILLPKCDLPSPFAHGLISRGMADVVLMEDRVRLLRNLRELVLKRIGSINE